MSERDDGGPAFPCLYPASEYRHNGLSLRDWFAGQALAGFAASPHNTPEDWNGPESVAEDAYRYADAMLKERTK